MTRFAVVRVPTAGPPALVGDPALFERREAAEARRSEIEARAVMEHHTWIDVVDLGDLAARDLPAALAAARILR